MLPSQKKKGKGVYLVGVRVGCAVVSPILLAIVPATDGCRVGVLVTATDGWRVGVAVAATDGWRVGLLLGACEGLRVGLALGEVLGAREGRRDGAVCWVVWSWWVGGCCRRCRRSVDDDAAHPSFLCFCFHRKRTVGAWEGCVLGMVVGRSVGVVGDLQRGLCFFGTAQERKLKYDVPNCSCLLAHSHPT